MQEFYQFLDENHYFWDRKDTTTIWVALNGYKVFDESYENLMSAAKTSKALYIADQFDNHCGKTFYFFKETRAVRH